jgi:hypothetical protein
MPAITVVASPSSGGALNRYNNLKGAKVYTIYIQTRMGTAVMEYADSTSTSGFQADLTAPEPMDFDVPSALAAERMIVSCVIDRAGVMTQLRVLEAANSEKTEQIMSALRQWKFRPVLRGEEPIEVKAILGFGVNTR